MAVTTRSTAGGTDSGDLGHGPAAATTRIITRRRSLPSARAVVGGFLVLLAALGAFAAARGGSDDAGRRYVVAGRDIAIGTTLTEDDLSTTVVDLTDDLGDHAFTQITPLVGTVAVAPIGKGELVQRGQLVEATAAGSGYHVPLPLDRSRALGGDIQPGQRVDVLVTYGSGTTAVTLVVARHAAVVAVDLGDDSGFGTTSEISIILSVTPDEYLAVTHASQVGDVTLVRPLGATSGEGSPGEYHPPIGDDVRDSSGGSGTEGN